MSDDHDELTGIFDNLNPDDFSDNATTPIALFNRFVDSNVDAIRKSYIAAEGEIQVITVLDSPAGKETIIPAYDGESLGEYVERVRSEAHSIGAVRLFLCRRAQVASKMIDMEEMKPVDDASWVGQPEVKLVDGLIYYAERLESGVREARIGIMRGENGDLVDRTEIDARLQPIDLFANMLG